MKFKLVFAPVWEITSPYPSIPCLTAFLKKHGVDVEQVDMNLKVFDHIFSEKYLLECIEEAESENVDDKSLELLRYFAQNVEGCKRTIRSEKAMNPQTYKSCRSFLANCLSAINNIRNSETLSFSKYSFSGYKSSDRNSLVKTVSEIISGRKSSHLLEIMKIFSDELVADADAIGFSIASDCQVLPTMLLAAYCKKIKPDVKIIMGGSLVTRWSLSKSLLKLLFEYSDFFSFYEGELSLLSFARYMNGEIPVEQIPSVAYMKGAEVFITPKSESLPMDELPTPEYCKENLSLYFAPVPVLTLFSCRGCYWNKCAFCDHAVIYQDCFRLRSVELIIKDIETCIEKYSTKYFAFNDEAITVPMLRSLSKAIIDKNLDIRWRDDARFSKNLDKETLELAHKAGLRILFFGLESYNERVLKAMNKGIKLEWVEPVLKDSFEAGIWNHVYLIAGFPTETDEEFKDTYDFAIRNHKYIDSLCLTPFGCSSFSDVALNPQKYNLELKNTKEYGFLINKDVSGAVCPENYTFNRRHTIGRELTAKGNDLLNAFPNTMSVVFSDYLINMSRNSEINNRVSIAFGTPLYSDNGIISYVESVSDNKIKCTKVSSSLSNLLKIIYQCNLVSEARTMLSESFGYPEEVADVIMSQIKNAIY